MLRLIHTTYVISSSISLLSKFTHVATKYNIYRTDCLTSSSSR